MYHHILLATDLSPASEEALKVALQMSEAFRSKLSIVYVIDEVPPYACAALGMSEFTEEFEAGAREALEALKNKIGRADIEYLLEHGSTKLRIVKAARNVDADLILVGSHGRHGLARLIGSTANGVVQGSECDVLVVKSLEHT